MKVALRRIALTALVAALAACGGTDQSTPNGLVVFGDSLSDVGTYKVGSIAQLSAAAGGGRWTVNSLAGGEMWSERMAAELGFARPCPAETGLRPNLPGITGAAVTAQPGCTNYAQGSSRVTSSLGPSSYALQAAPYSQVNLGFMAKPVSSQIDAHLAAVNGAIDSRNVIVVMAGANDVFMEVALTAAPGTQAAAAAAVANVGAAGAALGQLVKTKLVAAGASRILVANVPDINGTPFGATLDAATRGLIDTMVTTFNSQLAGQLSGVAQVRLVDLYSRSKDQVANPAKYGISSVSAVACGTNALGTTSLVCNGTNVVAGDVSRYAFADDVHPSAYGQQLIAQFLSAELTAANWR
jgi:phospholipase/lecithinase/hemolysin